jgi:hypothetical protein
MTNKANNSFWIRVKTCWNSFFFTRLDARPIALFRIAIGVLSTVMILCSAPNWDRFFHADGIISLHSAGLNNTRVNDPIGLFYWTEGWIPIETMWYVSLITSITFTLGYYSRVSTVFLLVLIRSMLIRNPYLANGEEMVIEMSLFYMIWVNMGSAYSVDSWIANRKGKPLVKTVLAWPVRMLQINIALIYVISLPYKLAQDPGWVTGDALHWTVASDMWGPSDYPWITLAFGGLIRKIITFSTVFIEAFFPVFVWFRRTRLLAIFLISALHLGIAILIPNVTYFTLAMNCCFLVFLTGRDIELMEKKLARMTRAESLVAGPSTV